MISIKQDSKLHNLETLLSKHGKTFIKIDIELMLRETNIIKKEFEKAKQSSSNINNLKNYLNIITYMDRLGERVDRSRLELEWEIDSKGLVKSNPIALKNIEEYKINSNDCISIKNESIIHMDFSELADIIAFELMYRDLGETHKSMEEKLKEIGITAIYDSSELSKYFNESPFKLSKILKIGNSNYRDAPNHKIFDYFSQRKFKDSSYKECVEYSCKYAMAIVLESLMSNIQEIGKNIKLVSIDCNEIYFITENLDISKIKNEINQNVIIRAFGRKFEVEPKITIY